MIRIIIRGEGCYGNQGIKEFSEEGAINHVECRREIKTENASIKLSCWEVTVKVYKDHFGRRWKQKSHAVGQEMEIRCIGGKLIEKKRRKRGPSLGQGQERKKQISINYSWSVKNYGLLRMFQTYISSSYIPGGSSMFVL